MRGLGLTLLCFVVSMLSGCATLPAKVEEKIACDFQTSAPRPGWADLDYPAGNKIYGVGISSPVLTKPDGRPNPYLDKKRAAQIAAKADLAEQVNVEVYSRFEQEIVSDDEEMSARVQSLIRTSTQRQMGFVRFSDTWSDGTSCTVYVLAELPSRYVDMMLGQVREVVQ